MTHDGRQLPGAEDTTEALSRRRWDCAGGCCQTPTPIKMQERTHANANARRASVEIRDAMVYHGARQSGRRRVSGRSPRRDLPALAEPSANAEPEAPVIAYDAQIAASTGGRQRDDGVVLRLGRFGQLIRHAQPPLRGPPA